MSRSKRRKKQRMGIYEYKEKSVRWRAEQAFYQEVLAEAQAVESLYNRAQASSLSAEWVLKMQLPDGSIGETDVAGHLAGVQSVLKRVLGLLEQVLSDDIALVDRHRTAVQVEADLRGVWQEIKGCYDAFGSLANIIVYWGRQCGIDVAREFPVLVKHHGHEPEEVRSG